MKVKYKKTLWNCIDYSAIYIPAIAIILSLSCCTEVKRPSDVAVKPIDVSIADTVGNKYSADAEMFEIAREFNLSKDSLEVLKDSIIKVNVRLLKAISSRDSVIRVNVSTKEKLAVAEYKILRIREYNRIAAQGNNIVFLRGWISRTINK